MENDWDQTFTCKNTCKIHLRCEGIAFENEDEELPEGYECGQCEKKKPNHEWIKETLISKNHEYTQKQLSINLRITSLKAEIDYNEHLEETVTGPRQRQFKEALKKLGDVARFHGGDLQGKQVQKLLDDARNETEEFSPLACTMVTTPAAAAVSIHVFVFAELASHFLCFCRRWPQSLHPGLSPRLPPRLEPDKIHFFQDYYSKQEIRI